MKSSEFYLELGKSFAANQRQAHLKPGSGLFVKAMSTSWHHLELSSYPISNSDKIYAPRVTIDRYSSVKLSARVAKAWGVPTEKSPLSGVKLEITVLPLELGKLAEVAPMLITAIEKGDKEFGPLLPFNIVETTKTNIWSVDADAYAITELKKHGRFKR